jgi:hypothetical protein
VARARPAQSQVLFLARPTQLTLDGGTTDATWTSAERELRLLRPVGRDDGPPAVFLRLRPRGLVPPTQRHDLRRHSTTPDVHPTGLVALGEVCDTATVAQKLRLLGAASDLVPVERTEQAHFRPPAVSPSTLVSAILDEATAWAGAGFSSLAVLTGLVVVA